MIDALADAARTPAFKVIALVVTLAMGWFLSQQAAQLRNHHAPNGGIALQRAWTGERAKEVVDSWKPERLKRIAYWQVLLDFIFIAGYVALLVAVAVATERAASASGLTLLAWAAGWAIYGSVAAGVFDCLENFGLLAMLWGCINTPIAFMTSIFSTLKFLLILAVSAVAVVTFIAA